MKKLIQGIVDFRKSLTPEQKENFARLALGQSPDALLIACSDSRVVPNLFASTNPGDLFVVRNVGNIIPPCGDDGVSVADESEAAAIEFAVLNLNVADIVVCGHSECGAMQAIAGNRETVKPAHLREWLRHGEASLPRLEDKRALACCEGLARHDALSRLNVLQQLDHLMSYPFVRERVEAGKLRLHGWWFDIGRVEVLAYDADERRFSLVDEQEGTRHLGKVKKAADELS